MARSHIDYVCVFTMLFAGIGAACNGPQWDTYDVVHVYPHDPTAFTEGLIYLDGYLYESTGRNGLSVIRKLDASTGITVQETRLRSRYFGEGLTDWGPDLIQITWKEHTGFVYDRETLSVKREWTYAGEGWGLTHDSTQLIMSNGTSVLTFLNPANLQPTAHLLVQDRGRPVEGLNELEYIHGEVYANVWKTNQIVRISERSGVVISRIDLSGLLSSAEAASADVLNGIAYDAAQDTFFVTGKLWPKIFEIKVHASHQ